MSKKLKINFFMIIGFFLNPVLIIFGSIISAVSFPFDKEGNFNRQLIRAYLQLHSYFTGFIVEAEGIENINKSANYFVLANFTDVTDIFAVLKSFPKSNILCILRIHNFYIPFIGIIFLRAKFIKFRQKRIANFINSVATALKAGYSVLHFPAGYSDLSKSDYLYHNFIAITKKANSLILPTQITHLTNDKRKIIVKFKSPIRPTDYRDDKDLKKKLLDELRSN